MDLKTNQSGFSAQRPVSLSMSFTNIFMAHLFFSQLNCNIQLPPKRELGFLLCFYSHHHCDVASDFLVLPLLNFSKLGTLEIPLAMIFPQHCPSSVISAPASLTLGNTRVASLLSNRMERVYGFCPCLPHDLLLFSCLLPSE